MTEPLAFGKKAKENGIVLFVVVGKMQILFQMNMSHLLNLDLTLIKLFEE